MKLTSSIINVLFVAVLSTLASASPFPGYEPSPTLPTCGTCPIVTAFATVAPVKPLHCLSFHCDLVCQPKTSTVTIGSNCAEKTETITSTVTSSCTPVCGGCTIATETATTPCAEPTYK